MEYDAKAKTYSIWKAMNKRCRRDHNYVTKGIMVCPQWQAKGRDGKAFDTFVSDMGLCPSPKHSIDRIDNSGHYSPQNCRWADSKIQGNNKSDNRYITYQGQTLTMSQWAERLGMSYYAIRARLRLGWEVEAALTTPIGGKPSSAIKYLFENEQRTIVEIASAVGMPEPTLRARLGKGQTLSEAIVTQKRKNARNVTAFGETLTITEWSTKTGINANTLRSRILYKGVSPEEALTTKIPSR